MIKMPLLDDHFQKSIKYKNTGYLNVLFGSSMTTLVFHPENPVFHIRAVPVKHISPRGRHFKKKYVRGYI